jgi:hypothetical protein
VPQITAITNNNKSARRCVTAAPFGARSCIIADVAAPRVA